MSGCFFQIALNYGGRDEILRAVTRMNADARAGRIPEEKVSPELFESYLDTAGIPDPDLLIRTSGEERISNFPSVAAGLHGILFYGCALAGPLTKRNWSRLLKNIMAETGDTEESEARRRKEDKVCL